jgi:hypothetical protein
MTAPPRQAPHLRLVEDKPARPAGNDGALKYTNRHGEHYYLHQGRTKTGKVRVYVARTVGEGALDAMPSGFEIAESINGVVSVRRADPSRPQVPPADLETVCTEVARHEHLRRYVVDGREGEIFIHESEQSFDPEGVREMAALFGVSVERVRAASIRRRPRFAPVMKFAPEPISAGVYVVHRMTYGGHGGWHMLSAGPLAALARRYVGHLGKESFFELL